MSNGDRVQQQVEAFEAAVEEYLQGSGNSDAPRQRTALRDMARIAAMLQSLSGGSPSALAPLLEHPNKEVRLMASLYQHGKLHVLEDTAGVKGPVPEIYGTADEARVQSLVQTYVQSVLGLHAARKAGDAKAVKYAALGLIKVPLALMKMNPPRMDALAVLLEHENLAVRVMAAATLMAEMPDRVFASLRNVCATYPGTLAAQQAAALMEKFAGRAPRNDR